MKTALVCGAGGFIGGHLVKKLKREGYCKRSGVRGVDIKEHEFAPTEADEFLLLDLRKPENCRAALTLGQTQGKPGLEGGRRPRLPSAARWPGPKAAVRLRCGAMGR